MGRYWTALWFAYSLLPNIHQEHQRWADVWPLDDLPTCYHPKTSMTEPTKGHCWPDFWISPLKPAQEPPLRPTMGICWPARCSCTPTSTQEPPQEPTMGDNGPLYDFSTRSRPKATKSTGYSSWQSVWMVPGTVLLAVNLWVRPPQCISSLKNKKINKHFFLYLNIGLIL